MSIIKVKLFMTRPVYADNEHYLKQYNLTKVHTISELSLWRLSLTVHIYMIHRLTNGHLCCTYCWVITDMHIFSRKRIALKYRFSENMAKTNFFLLAKIERTCNFRENIFVLTRMCVRGEKDTCQRVHLHDNLSIEG